MNNPTPPPTEEEWAWLLTVSSASCLVQDLVELGTADAQDPGSLMWESRQRVALEAWVPVLVWARDHLHTVLDRSGLCRALENPWGWFKEGFKGCALPQALTGPLCAYLRSLPGMSADAEVHHAPGEVSLENYQYSVMPVCAKLREKEATAGMTARMLGHRLLRELPAASQPKCPAPRL